MKPHKKSKMEKLEDRWGHLTDQLVPIHLCMDGIYIFSNLCTLGMKVPLVTWLRTADGGIIEVNFFELKR